MRTASNVRIPQYCRHKARGLGYVRLGDEVTYLGKYGTPESMAEYRRLVGEWLGTSQHAPAEGSAQSVMGPLATTAHPTDEGMTVREFGVVYLKYAQSRYDEHRYSGIRIAFIAMDDLFGKTPIAEFGPKRLKEVRQVFVTRGLKRQVVNRHVKYILNGIKWGVSDELISGEIITPPVCRRNPAAG